MRRRSSWLVTACILLLAGIACRNVPEKKGLLERNSGHSQLTSHQLRVMVNEFMALYADRIEMSADRVLAVATDPAIRRNALLWKINGISACFQAASRSDPLGAYLDIWILNRQMALFFRSPEGSQVLGDQLPIALETCDDLEQRLQFINEAAGAELPLGEKFVTTFASDFPLTSLYFDREPIASRYIEEVQEPARELFQVVADLNESLTEMRALSTLYAEYLPKQARWEAQLMLVDTTQTETVQQPLQDLASAALAAARIADTTDSVPELLRVERVAVQDFIRQERQDTVAAMERMRVAAVADLRDERIAVLAALSSERQLVQQQLDVELSRTLQAADDISRKRAMEISDQAPKLIDHFIWRICQMVGAAIAIVLIYIALRSLYDLLVGRDAVTQETLAGASDRMQRGRLLSRFRSAWQRPPHQQVDDPDDRHSKAVVVPLDGRAEDASRAA